jgi:sugar lactone lactonase YvrE
LLDIAIDIFIVWIMDYIKSSPSAEIWPVEADVGECPFWDTATGSLFWVDIRRPSLNQQAANGARLASWPLPDPVGAFALLEGESRALVALASGLAILDLATGCLLSLTDPEPDRPHNRLNEGKVSPCGRWFVFGSMDDRPDKQATGALYCMGIDGSVRRLVDRLIVANGLAWSPDGDTLFYSDSRTATIRSAPWNAADGSIGAARPFARVTEAEGRPDGAAMDAEGCYWSAGVSAGCLNRFSPDGRIIEKIMLPVRAPTMPAFGPPGQGVIYVTSHRRIADPGPDDGAIVVIPATAVGLPQRRFALPSPGARAG